MAILYPRKAPWWGLRSLGVEEWVVCITQGLYAYARSRVRVNGQYSSDFEVGLSVHQSITPLYSKYFLMSYVLVNHGNSFMLTISLLYLTR